MKLIFEHQQTPANRKTPRIRGVITKFILEVAAQNGTITARDIEKHLGYARSWNNLHALAQRGILKVVNPGKRGRVASRPAVFQLNSAGRPAAC